MKLSNSSQRKYGIILNYVRIALTVLFGIIYTPIMIRLLGKNEYGLYGTVMSFIGLLDLLNLGFGNSYIKFYSKYKSDNEDDKIKSFNALFTLVFSVLGLIALVIGLFFSFNLNLVFDKGLSADEYSKARIMIILLSFSTALNFAFTIFTTYISAYERFVFQKIVGLISYIINVAVNLIVLYNGFGAVGLVVSALAISIIFKAINIYYCFAKLNLEFDFKHIEKGLFKQIFAFSGLIAINMIVDKVNQGIDSVLLGRFCGTSVVAVYTVGASINSYFTNFSTAISGVFVPKVHNLVNSYEMDSKEQREALTAFFVKVARIQFLLLALLASGIVFFGKAFIRFWAGDGFDEAYYIAMILVLPSIIPLSQNVGIEIQRAENRHHYRSYLYGLTAIVNLVSSYFMCQIWGGIGSAIGTCGATIIATVILMNIVYHKNININVFEYWKNIGKQLLGMIVPFAFGTVIMLKVNFDSIIKLVVYIALYSLVYIAFVISFSTNSSEKEMIKSLLRKVKLLK